MKRLFFNSLLIVVLGLPFSVRADETTAAERGLAWLASHQKADGSWNSNAGLNALSMLAFLSAGHVSSSKAYGENLNKGIEYILAHQGADGTFTNNGAMMFGHGITTLLLAEMDGMDLRTTKLHAALERSVKVILHAQEIPKGDIYAGGWRYFPDSKDSDIAVTIWQVAALRAALDAGVKIPKENFTRAAAYIKRCEHPRGGLAYQPGGFVNPGRTAGGVLALRMCGQFNDPVVARCLDWLKDNPVHWEDDFVYHSAFFCSHLGHGFSAPWLLDHQNDDGSWALPPHSTDESEAGTLYTTSMAVMILTAHNNFLPIFAVND